jgi:uncharacterized repeat protein (TIGR02543 family)
VVAKIPDIEVSVSANTGNLERTGYTFSGWNTQPDGLGTDYAAGSSYTANETVTLYAKWKVLEVVDIGPSGGYVFYDDSVGFDMDGNGTIEDDEKDLLDGTNDGVLTGVRYLEAAPTENTITSYVFGYYKQKIGGTMLEVGTDTKMGSGKENTRLLIAAMGNTA